MGTAISRKVVAMFTSQKDFDFTETVQPVVPAARQPSAHPQRPRSRTATSFGNHKSLKVLNARFEQVRRYRGFCRMEAIVTVTFQYHPSLPPRTERLLTSVPIKATGVQHNFRQRLIKSAINLSVLMHRAERGGCLRTL